MNIENDPFKAMNNLHYPRSSLNLNKISKITTPRFN
jgi:hypothetical protein